MEFERQSTGEKIAVQRENPRALQSIPLSMNLSSN